MHEEQYFLVGVVVGIAVAVIAYKVFTRIRRASRGDKTVGCDGCPKADSCSKKSHPDTAPSCGCGSK